MVHNLICNSILPYVNGEHVDICTMIKWNGMIFCGNPNYLKGSWHDWVYINWGDRHGITPNQIICYVDLSTLKSPISINSTYIQDPGTYALIHMVANPLDSHSEDDDCTNFKAHQESRLFYWSTKMEEKQPPNSYRNLQVNIKRPLIGIANINTFVQPCIAVPASLEGNQPNLYLFLKPQKLWPVILDKFMHFTINQSNENTMDEEENIGPIY